MKMQMQHRLAHLGFAALLAASAGCGNLGNYSNEDIDFQLAVPEREDLAANLTSQQALVVGDAAEYLVVTREVVGGFNRLIDAFTSIVDRVRALTPNERQPDLRVWGPFAHERDPRWELRMRMTRAVDATTGTGHRFDYQIEFHRTGTSDAWQQLMTGWFAPGGGARRGNGVLNLMIEPARAAGYPVAEFNELDTLQVVYQRGAFPHTVKLTITNVASAESPMATIAYSAEADGGGAMTFVWRTRANLLVQALGITSRWRPGGAGRADARVVEGLGALNNLVVGTDCWAANGRATYARRDFDPKRLDGAEATCVLGPPAP